MDRTSCPGRGKHGTCAAARNRGCTCPDALLAARRYRKRRSAGLQPAARVDPTGTARRLRALAAIGWSSAELGHRLGCSTDHITWLRTADRHDRGLYRTSAARVAALYDQLEGTPGPSSSARSRAARARWAPPLAWDGTDIDDPAARPDLGRRTRGVIDPDDVAHFGAQALARHLGVEIQSIAVADRRARRKVA